MAISKIKRTYTGSADIYGAISGQVMTDVTVSSSTSWATLGSFTLPTGAWLVIVSAVYASNATGYRRLSLAEESAAAGTNIRTIRTPAVSGDGTAIVLSCLCTGGTWYITGGQNSGSSLTCSVRCTSVRLGDKFVSV